MSNDRIIEDAGGTDRQAEGQPRLKLVLELGPLVVFFANCAANGWRGISRRSPNPVDRSS